MYLFQAPQLKHKKIYVKLTLFDNKDIPVTGDIVLYRSYSETQIYWLQHACKTIKRAFRKGNPISCICKEQILIIQSRFLVKQELHKS